MTEAEKAYERTVGFAADNDTKRAVGLVWAIEQASSLAERVKIAKEALDGQHTNGWNAAMGGGR